ncbi:metallophosphoesterase family protein [Nannocystis punicea]|uniref:Metallophosphoesterase family protein n=1 Tax=Nannocystis punicea TaxID=2995304 RepID=A0ABY7GYS0_9BACT|nr:metallophosphoesterase family protein [Nannocystis poenicansa]WAS91999.1 metallophosphoesterase family protein [Nannocystis poenicansa]
MRLAALSDFHIGARAGMDEFRHDEGVFLERLARVVDTHDRVVLVGDIWQTDHALFTGRRAAARQLQLARRRLPRLTRALDRLDYVHGNHDFIARDELGAPSELQLDADGCRVLFLHGHQYDPVFARAYAAARAATWFTGRLRRAGLGPVAHYFEQKDIAIKHRRFGHAAGPYAAAARALMRERGADIVVMGHTHVAHAHHMSEGTVVNTGTCAGGRFTVVTVDTAARAVTIAHDPPA